MRTNSLPVVLGLLLSICLLSGTVSPVSAVEGKEMGYASLQGVKHVDAVFDFRIGDPKSAALHLDVIRQTCKDTALQLWKKPAFAVVFSGPSVKLLTTKREGLSADDAKALDEIAGTIAAMAKEGIRLEACRIALKVFGIDPVSVLPELLQVGNGYVALIGYEAQRYSLVPVY